MRFHPKLTHPIGAQRNIERFAFWPTKMYNGTIVWLEIYWVVQVYDRPYTANRDFHKPTWTDRELYVTSKN